MIAALDRETIKALHSQQALQFAVVGAQQFKGRRGRHQTNFLETIRADLRPLNQSLVTETDIIRLREQASDKAQWKEFSNTKHAHNLRKD